MSELKVEIKLIGGDWQWLGKLTKKQLNVLCKLADAMSDSNDEV